jgi:hypothetical protein
MLLALKPFDSLRLCYPYILMPLQIVWRSKSRAPSSAAPSCRRPFLHLPQMAVTMPFKIIIKNLLDDFTPAAKQLGAVNTVIPRLGADGKRILIGDNTDWVSSCWSYKLVSSSADHLHDRSASEMCLTAD